MTRQEKDYEMVLDIPNLGNRDSILQQYLDHLRLKLFEAIEIKDHFEIERVDKKITSLKNSDGRSTVHTDIT